MTEKAKKNPYDLSRDFKKLPIKKRAGLINFARNLLEKQKKDTILADASVSNKGNEGIG